jgi:hypothetical protein
VAALAAALHHALRDSYPGRKFEGFFREALAMGSTDDNFLLGRFASRYDVCIYGMSDPVAESGFATFFGMVRNETWMQPNLIYRTDVSNCPETTFFYVFHHKGEDSVIRSTIDDLTYITARHGMTFPQDHSLYFQTYSPGLVVQLAPPGKDRKVYSAINGFAGTSSEADKMLAHNIIQQELLQAILNAGDLEVNRTPVSIIEEWNISTPLRAPMADPQYRAQWLEHNVYNMCLYDIMLLITLYAWDESILDDRLGSYIRYIRNNYEAIEKRAREIQYDERYSDIFVQKC